MTHAAAQRLASLWPCNGPDKDGRYTVTVDTRNLSLLDVNDPTDLEVYRHLRSLPRVRAELLFPDEATMKRAYAHR